MFVNRLSKRLLLWLLLSHVALAQMPEKLREEFSDPELYGLQVIGSSETSKIMSAMGDPETRILCLQLMEEDLPESLQGDIMAWVRAGHTVWFYDARLAPRFGMKPFFINSEQFKNADEKGELGGRKLKGLATTGVSHTSHEVCTGVGQVTVFLPRLFEKDEQWQYGAIEPTPGVVPLLQFTLDSPALISMRRSGRGLIVHKALLWPEPLSGERFQRNLLEFSAGFQVPGPAGVGRVGRPPGPEAEFVEDSGVVMATPMKTPPSAPTPTASPSPKPESNGGGQSGQGETQPGDDRFELQGGQKLQGQILDLEQVRFETGNDSLTLPVTAVATIELGGRLELDRLTLRDGTVHKGLLLVEEFKLKTGRDEQTLEKTSVKRIDFGERAEKGEKK